MKTNRMIAVAIFVMMAFTASVAFAESAVSLGFVDNGNGTVDIVATGDENVAGAAFTVVPGDGLTITSVSSTFFDAFVEGAVEGYPSPLTTNPETHLKANETAGSMKIAAARAEGKDVTAGVTLFTLTVAGDDGEYGISIEPTILDNKEAGYDPDKLTEAERTLDLLIGIGDDPDDPYPARLAYEDVDASGTVTLQSTIDSDADGMDDTWETTNFGDLTTSDGTGDADQDGYSDKQEYDNVTAPDTKNDAGATGYNDLSDVRETNLDIDGNGSLDGLTDGMLIARFLLGMPDAVLIAGAVAADCTRCDLDSIKTYLEKIDEAILDVDGNGSLDGLTDGMMAIRYALGMPDSMLTVGATAADCTRCDLDSVKPYLETLIPPSE